MRGVFFCVQKRREYLQAKRWSLGRPVHQRRSADGKARYAYVYGKSYADAKQKLLDRRITQAQNIDCSPSHTKYGDILRNWIAMSRIHIKESTYSPICPSCKCPHSTLLRRTADGQADYPDGRKNTSHFF